MTESLDSRISRITPLGVRTVLSNSTSQPVGIAIDSSGDYIVMDTGTNQLLKITPLGVRTVIFDFAPDIYPTGDTYPGGVAIDSSGCYIVAEVRADKLSRITPAGVRTEIFSFTRGTSPYFVAIDSSGDYIVTEGAAGKLSKIIPEGVRSEIFTFERTLTWPTGIAIDSSGNYIVAECFACRLSEITTLGVRTVIYNFTEHAYPFGVAIVPSRAVGGYFSFASGTPPFEAVPSPEDNRPISVPADSYAIMTPYLVLAMMIGTATAAIVLRKRKD